MRLPVLTARPRAERVHLHHAISLVGSLANYLAQEKENTLLSYGKPQDFPISASIILAIAIFRMSQKQGLIGDDYITDALMPVIRALSQRVSENPYCLKGPRYLIAALMSISMPNIRKAYADVFHRTSLSHILSAINAHTAGKTRSQSNVHILRCLAIHAMMTTTSRSHVALPSRVCARERL